MRNGLGNGYSILAEAIFHFAKGLSIPEDALYTLEDASSILKDALSILKDVLCILIRC